MAPGLICSEAMLQIMWEVSSDQVIDRQAPQLAPMTYTDSTA